MTNRIKLLESDIVDMYLNQKLATKKISDTLKINLKTVLRVLKNNNVELRKCKKNRLGNKYGRLTVIRYTRNDNSEKPMWECKCECGNRTEVRGSDLEMGKIKSCGCLHAESSIENLKIAHKLYPKSYGFKGIGDMPSSYFSQIKYAAKGKKREYSVSKEYLWDLFLKQNRKCALTGLDIYFGFFGKKVKRGTASLDRIDSSKGYIEGNVQWLHKDINNMKQDYSVDEFLNYCKLVTNNKN